MISQTTEYALRAMVILCSDIERQWTTAEIAKLSKVPPDYLSKVLQQLTKAKLIMSLRGAKGGFRLFKKPEELTILEVVQAVDPLPRIRKCPLGLRSHGTNLCALHRRLDNAMELVEKAFANSTLSELVPTRSSVKNSTPCEFPLAK
ncbi:MAG: Rrf2 family transcriptional regulator [Bdellovibrionota bacterium]